MSELVSELSLGEKLSLKGQLFELQKKLKTIDMSSKQREEYSFKPKISDYDLPGRDVSYSKNVERAELIRKQRLDMLKATANMEEQMVHTFTPTINKKSLKLSAAAKDKEVKEESVKNPMMRSGDNSLNSGKEESKDSSQKSVGERLYGYHKAYSANKEKIKEQVTQYDSKTGQKLYTPQISAKSKKMTTPKSPIPSAGKNISADLGQGFDGNGNEISAHEFMYRDAMDREQRLKDLSRENKAELNRKASESKLNSRSKQLLNQRIDRETRALYDALDLSNSGKLDYDNILRGFEILHSKGKLEKDLIFQRTQQVWEYLTFTGTESGSMENGVSYKIFAEKATPVVSRTAQSSALPKKSTLQNDTVLGNSSVPLSEKKKGFGSSTTRGFSDFIETGNFLEDGKGKVISAIKFPNNENSLVSEKGYSENNNITPKMNKKIFGDDADFDHVNTSAIILTNADVFKDFVVKLLMVLRASKEYAKSVDISRIREKKYQETLEVKNIRGAGQFAPTLGAVSRRLALSKEEREVNTLIQNAKNESSDNNSDKVDTTGEKKVDFTENFRGEKIQADKDAQQITGNLKNRRELGLKLMLERDKKSRKHKEHLQHLAMKEEREQCTFQPKVNKKVVKLHPTNSVGVIISNPASPEFERCTSAGDLVENGNGNDGNLYMASELLESNDLERTGKCEENEEVCTETLSPPPPPPPRSADSVATEKNHFRKELSKLPVSERLYVQRPTHYTHPHHYVTKEERDEAEEEKELEKCTFSPSLNEYHPPPHSLVIQAQADGIEIDEEIKQPTGWNTAISRLRNAANKRRTAMKEKEDDYVEAERRYIKSREIAKKGFKEFKFKSDDRIARAREKKKIQESKAQLYVDVKLSASKTVQIALHDNDDPAEMAERFCRIYSLNKDSLEILEEVIRQSMEVNNIKRNEKVVAKREELKALEAQRLSSEEREKKNREMQARIMNHQKEGHHHSVHHHHASGNHHHRISGNHHGHHGSMHHHGHNPIDTLPKSNEKESLASVEEAGSESAFTKPKKGVVFVDQESELEDDEGSQEYYSDEGSYSSRSDSSSYYED